jgi:MoaA/NifB/PqqE/SkfB family radical SAM enzyme
LPTQSLYLEDPEIRMSEDMKSSCALGTIDAPAGILPAPTTADETADTLHQPTCLYLEITDRCNMNCPMCITRGYRAGDTARLLTRDEIWDKLLLPFQEMGARHFVISGGEPMLSPIMTEVLSDAAVLGYDITFASNILSEKLNSFNDILMILDEPRHGFQFSFDSIYEKEMNAIRGKDAYCMVLENLSKITSLKHRHGYKTRLFAQVVVQEQNLDSVLETVGFLIDDVGVDGCSVQPRVDYHNVTLKNLHLQTGPALDEDQRAQLLDVARILFDRAATDRRLIVEGRTYENWERFCTNPLEIEGPCNSRNMVMVGPYGDFRGCLFSPNSGNIREISLGEYLESDARRDFLALAKVCRICINGCS